jgi:hypothetical protein
MTIEELIEDIETFNFEGWFTNYRTSIIINALKQWDDHASEIDCNYTIKPEIWAYHLVCDLVIDKMSDMIENQNFSNRELLDLVYNNSDPDDYDGEWTRISWIMRSASRIAFENRLKEFGFIADD